MLQIFEIQIANIAVVREIGLLKRGQDDRSPHEGPFTDDGILLVLATSHHSGGASGPLRP